ncbi:MAG: hypothetical protein GPJ54_19820 [Candidatus Heimdallarchaeota archaeon]|nr:hypothetical protein [Candidatus Heimdallarchaeota archaeon]
MKLKISIELPYWLSIPDKQIFKSKLNDKLIYNMMINQDYWRVRGVGADNGKSLIKNERDVINLNTLKTYDTLPSILETNFEEAHHFIEKLPSVMEFLIENSDEKSHALELKLSDQFTGIDSIWNEIKNEINIFLRIYASTFVSQIKSYAIYHLPDTYYNAKNVRIQIKRKISQQKRDGLNLLIYHCYSKEHQ